MRGEEEIRYVIDFYSGDQKEAVGIHIDVRPAIDSPGNLADRIKMGFLKLQRQAPKLTPNVAPPVDPAPSQEK
jgi:hypothetical protein